jgi:hypothetical protein
MTLDEFLQTLQNNPERLEFADTMQVIDTLYNHTPTAFRNGNIRNDAGQNNGSCKLFAFARLHELDEKQTLACFGRYYRDDVLGNPQGSDHQNIRQFMQHGWAGIHHEGEALQPRPA